MTGMWAWRPMLLAPILSREQIVYQKCEIDVKGLTMEVSQGLSLLHFTLPSDGLDTRSTDGREYMTIACSGRFNLNFTLIALYRPWPIPVLLKSGV